MLLLLLQAIIHWRTLIVNQVVLKEALEIVANTVFTVQLIKNDGELL